MNRIAAAAIVTMLAALVPPGWAQGQAPATKGEAKPVTPPAPEKPAAVKPAPEQPAMVKPAPAKPAAAQPVADKPVRTARRGSRATADARHCLKNTTAVAIIRCAEKYR